MVKKQEYELEDFADHEVQEYADTPIPTFLKWVYAILPIWGIIWWLCFWDGSSGWLDRGSWQNLEHAARTTKSCEVGQICD